MAFLETPSRILRRMEALEAQDDDLPSLPSMPGFEDTDLHSFPSGSTQSLSPNILQIGKREVEDEDDVPYHSTPTPASSHTTRSTMRPPPSTSSSATRFANSMRTSVTTARISQVQREESFEVTRILPAQQDSESSSASVPEFHLPPQNEHEDLMPIQRRTEEDMSFGNMIEPVGHSSSPLDVVLEEQHRTAGTKRYDYSISLRSEQKASPINPHRDVTVRKMPRTRTPSLSRTTPSPTSTSSNSTPRSTYSRMAHGTTPPVPVMDPAGFQDPQEHLSIAMEQEHQQNSGVSQTEDIQSLTSEDGLDQDVTQEEEARPEHERRDSSPESTFSSDEQPQSSGFPNTRTPFPKAFSSPSPSIMSIPTPVHVAQSTNAPAEGVPAPDRSHGEVPLDLATPYNRRRSFLLSLVHSTTRPRMTFPTPHPKVRAAPTPRPRAHPLSQVWTPSPAHFEPGSNPSAGSSLSPHDRLSFISTASSHDLTVHPRANASFDPVTGPKGVGRFNAVKLNTYLHGLNRRLQEENEMLIGRLRLHGEEIEMGKAAEELEREGFKTVEEAVLREVEAMRDELERCEQEKAAVAAESEVLSEQLEVLKSERETINNDLQYEREERNKDKGRWKNRMAELESGVEGVIKELERRLAEAEQAAHGKAEAEDEARKSEQRCTAIQEELDVVRMRAEKAEDALAISSDFGPEIKQANERATVYREESRAAREKVHDLELRLQDTERKGKDAKASIEDQLAEVDAELRHSLEAQQTAEAHALELDAEVKAAEHHIYELEEQLTTARQNAADILNKNSQLQIQKDRLTDDVALAAEAARQMEDALEESERKMISDEEELASLRARINHLERELETRQERSKSATLPHPDLSRSPNLEMDQLEAELDDAHREIAKLNYLLSGSPSRKAIDTAKDMRIELLEKEKDELSERVRSLRSMMSSPRKPASPAINTPSSYRQLSAFKSPMTPGAPLQDYSWLQGNTTPPSTSPLVAQIEHLQRELNLANDSIDVKVDKLEEAGMDIVALMERLEDARSRIVTLEEEVGRLTRRDGRRVRRLERTRCLSCGGKVDLSKLLATCEANQSSVELSSTTLPSDPPTPPSQTVEASFLIKQLREERESLAVDHAELQRRYVDASAHVSHLRQELATAQRSHDERRHQLDLRVTEIEGLRQELTQQARELERIELEKNKARDDRSGIVKTVASLESDLRRVRDDAETLGRNLKELKSERDRHRDELGKADRAQKQLCAQVRVTSEQLEAQREKTNKAVAEFENHVCDPNQEDNIRLRTQHKNECKGLMVQIRYLKAKFKRESLFRADLGYQKHYLLDLLASFEKSEEQILAVVARIGFPSQPQPIRKRLTMRAIAVAALFIAKARRSSEVWREQTLSKSAVTAALQEVRRRRVAASLESM